MQRTSWEGARPPYRPVPTFWSEQFNALIQIVDFSTGDTLSVRRIGPREGSESLWLYDRACQLKAVEVSNDSKTFSLAWRIVADGRSPLGVNIRPRPKSKDALAHLIKHEKYCTHRQQEASKNAKNIPAL